MEIAPATKVCSKCGEEKLLDGFTPHPTCRFGVRSDCRTCVSARTRAYNERNPAATRRARWRHQLSIYGLGEATFGAMIVAQGGRCVACDVPLERPHIDHCHATGRVRGVLCFTCNTALGLAKDSVAVLRNLIDYLETT